MGLFNWLIGTTSTNQINHDAVQEVMIDLGKKSTELEDYVNELEEGIRKSSADNLAFSKEFNIFFGYIHQGKYLEEKRLLEDALKMYLQAVDFFENSQKLHIHNCSVAINRVLVLYGKLKMYPEHIKFLKSIINKYPDYLACESWKLRLENVIAKRNRYKGNIIQ
jgi:tetratricopeptide (TPR) repeat protein